MESKIICLTPVLNEEWIIERFLKCASLWADIIIISDQGSTDSTVEIAKTFPKVRLIRNDNGADFDEQNMRSPLFREARKIAGKRILISLDADEFFTPNFDSPEWSTIRNSKEGTRFEFSWLNVLPGFETCFSSVNNICGFVDDGSIYDVGLIHVPRQPQSDNANVLRLNDISILHMQFIDWERMERKQLWYQMFERIHNPQKSKIQLYRIYNYTNPPLEVDGVKCHPIEDNWISGYLSLGIDITSVLKQSEYIWDEKIIRYLNEYGVEFFKYINIDISHWTKLANQAGVQINKRATSHDNRWFSRIVLFYLNRTQICRNALIVRLIDKVLIKLFLI